MQHVNTEEPVSAISLDLFVPVVLDIREPSVKDVRSGKISIYCINTFMH